MLLDKLIHQPLQKLIKTVLYPFLEVQENSMD